MLPVDLFDPVYGIIRKWVVDGYTGHRAPAEVIDHVINCLEFLLQIVCFTHITLCIARFCFSWFLCQATVKGGKSEQIQQTTVFF